MNTAAAAESLVRGTIADNVCRVLDSQFSGLGWTLIKNPTFDARPPGKSVTTDLAVATQPGGAHTQISSVCAVFDILPPQTDSLADRARLEKLRGRPSLRDLVIINANGFKVEHWFRSERSPWHFELLTAESDHVHVRSLGIFLGLANIYLRVAIARPPARGRMHS